MVDLAPSRRSWLKAFSSAAVVTAAAIVLGACGAGGGGSTTPPKLIVGAIHVGSIHDAGYNEAEHDGLVAMTKAIPGIKLLEAENVPEGPGVETVMENMIRQGATLIFPMSYGYQDFALNVAALHPGVYFEHPAGYKKAANFGTYWGASDMYSYSLGAAAGLMTKTNKIAFLGGFPIPQIIDSINAFHLGARSVNPSVTTYAIFNGTWSDPAKEATATNALADQGVDVVTGIVDSPISFVETAEKRGIMSIGYHSASVAKFAPNGFISGIDFQFGAYFTKCAQDTIDDKWTANNYIGDVNSGMVQLAPFGKKVPAGVQTKTLAVLQSFKDGTLKSPFVGPVYDQKGTLRIKPGEVPDWNFVNTVDWFAQGIVGQTS
ncbi:MAG TPA: BMP family ABC transporter substrate-binding protein [Candidatus Dormibacteraeota bacterium]|nr:BMP family ABC transporter substrate-binding protein [Candidatus Dormibacteraeota bacterium]